MIRKIIHIDQEVCNGCGRCAQACHEGAIGMVNGKAQLLRDDYCDGLGDCLPECPVNAITFAQREAAAYDAAAVEAHKKAAPPSFGGCPGSRSREIPRQTPAASFSDEQPSCLGQWPVQIQLAPLSAPYFENADLLIAADCTAYAYGAFHQRLLRGRVALIGCPKLDGVDYAEKLTEILRRNAIRSVTVARMEVPCCGGLEAAAKAALQGSGKLIPWQVVTISTDGKILSGLV